MKTETDLSLTIHLPETEPAERLDPRELLEQLELQVGSVPIAEKHRLWLLQGILQRMLRLEHQALQRFNELVKAAPSRSLPIRVMAFFEKAETEWRLDRTEAATATLKEVLKLSSSRHDSLDGQRKGMLSVRWHEVGAIVCFARHPIERSRQIVNETLGHASYPQQVERLNQLRDGLRGSVKQVRQSLHTPAYFRKRDASLFQEAIDFTTPIKGPSSDGP